MHDSADGRSDIVRGRTSLRLRLRKEKWVGLVVLTLAILAWVPRLRGPIDLRWDGSVYYILGTALAEGRGYKLLNEPGEISATQYPPLLPAIIAVHQVVLGTNDFVVVGSWLRISFFLVFVAYIGAGYRLVRTALPIESALLATTISLVSLFTWFISDLCFADILFGLSATMFFLCNAKSDRRAYAVAASCLAVAAYLLRTVGIALLVAWIAESLYQRRWRRSLIRMAVASLAILPWQFYVSGVESNPLYRQPTYAYQRADYLFYNVTYARNIFVFLDPLNPEKGHASLGSIARRGLHNVLRVPGSLGEGVSTNRGYWETFWARYTGVLPIEICLVLFGCLVLAGLFLHLASRRSVILPVYALVYLGLMCLTPWPGQFPRYLVPLMPLLAFWLLASLLAMQRLSHRALSGRWKIAGSIFAVGVVLLILVQELLTVHKVYTEEHQKVVYHDRNGNKVDYRLFFYNKSYRDFDEALDWLKSRAQSSDVVATSSPHWAFLRTGMKAVMPPFERDPARTQELLDTVPVRYLLQEEGTALDLKKFTVPVIQRFPQNWELVYVAPNASCSIFQRVNR